MFINMIYKHVGASVGYPHRISPAWLHPPHHTGQKGTPGARATLQVQLDPKRRQLILQEIQDEAASRTKENIRWNLLHPVKAMNMCIHIIYLLIDLFID